MAKKHDTIHEPAQSTITIEDMELDRKLQAMDRELIGQELISDPDPIGMEVTKERQVKDFLHEIPEYESIKPAAKYEDFKEQVQLAKIEGANSILIEKTLAKKVCKDPSLESVGYFIFQNVKCYLDGESERAISRDKMTVEARNHGHKTIG